MSRPTARARARERERVCVCGIGGQSVSEECGEECE